MSWISIHGLTTKVGSSIGKLQMAISTPPDFKMEQISNVVPLTMLNLMLGYSL